MWHSKSKYGNVKSGGYASRKEAACANRLRVMELAGLITDLREQVPYELIPAQYRIVTDEKGRPRKVCVERSVKYIADFVYRERGKTVVVDTKGFRTPEYIIKRKLMLYRHGIKIQEI